MGCMHRKQVQAIISLKTSINRLQYEISEKKNLADNFIDGFSFVSDVKNGK